MRLEVRRIRHPKKPKRPTWLYPVGTRITTKHGDFVCIVAGAGDQWWKQWAFVDAPATEGADDEG